MKVKIIGKTESTITLNKVGLTLRGQDEGLADIDNSDQKEELKELKNNGLISVYLVEPDMKETRDIEFDSEKCCQETCKSETCESETCEPETCTPEKCGAECKEAQEEDFDESEKSGSRVVVSTGSKVVEGKMSRSVIADMPESERTAASLEAMEKLEAEEADKESEKDEELDDDLDESKLDASEQMGRKAVVMAPGGEQKVDMVNSILPESDNIKEADAFIDTDEDLDDIDEETQEENVEKKSQDEPPTNKKDEEDDDFSDAFIEC